MNLADFVRLHVTSARHSAALLRPVGRPAEASLVGAFATNATEVFSDNDSDGAIRVSSGITKVVPSWISDDRERDGWRNREPREFRREGKEEGVISLAFLEVSDDGVGTDQEPVEEIFTSVGGYIDPFPRGRRFV